MQFHHHGYVSGEPRVQPADGVGQDWPATLPDQVDVLIIGAGPAGVIAAAQLAQFPHLTTRLIDRRPGRLVIGQADGIQARSVETFQAFGFAHRIIDEAYRITEMCFWKPDPEHPENIYRAARTVDDPTGISEFPHLIVNQARVLDYFVAAMAESPSRMVPDWGWDMTSLEVTDAEDYPVVVKLSGTGEDNQGQSKTVHARFVIGCDGAHSKVRSAIGCTMKGDKSNHAWGVMDVLAVTDFPDIRTKCAIQSRAGSILHIPREGGHLFRMYVDLGEVPVDNNGAVRDTPIEDIIAGANRILHPYSLDVKNVAWWSVYEVGHRLTDRFDNLPADDPEGRLPRVFICGDACHTHSAKAGQGMNVSMQDGWNIGWKLGHVLAGRAPEELLKTYSAERKVTAKNLIDFDKEWSGMMAKKPEDFQDPTELEDFYVRTAEFPAGFMTEYTESLITGAKNHQELASEFPIGKRFKSEQVIRLSDATPQHLGHLATADGRWRIYAFADRAGQQEGSKLAGFARWLATDPTSPLARQPQGGDDDAWFDAKVIYQQDHTQLDTGKVPAAFRPEVGPFKLLDLNKSFAPHPDVDIFATRGISRDGAVVVVRPDQYVAGVFPLDATAEIAAFFAGAMGVSSTS